MQNHILKNQLHDYTPKRVWKSGFSKTPHPLKVILWFLFFAAILIWLGQLSLKAVDKSNAAVCQDWNKNTAKYKAKGYLVGHSMEDIQMCESAGIKLN